MGKNQHQKDRMHITSIEWRRDFGGFKEKKVQRMLPLSFDCCSISLRPFKTPVCSDNGSVFEKETIHSYIKKFKKCPVTGEKMTKNDLFPLNFFKNEKGKYHCPLTFRVFNENSHIVAIKTTGNVFSFEAIDKLNIKPKNWFDVLNQEKFTKSDIITIQNPYKKDRLIQNFDHIVNNYRVFEPMSSISEKSSVANTISKISKSLSNSKKSPLIEFNGKRLPTKKTQPKNVSKRVKIASNDLIPSHSSLFTNPQMAASFTSTNISPVTNSSLRELTVIEKREKLYEHCKTQKNCRAFVRMHTSHGDMNFSLDVQHAPATCHNFLLLSARGYYDNTIFHRLIISFMVQGGDPLGTGYGGESAFGGKIKDELSKILKHDRRGVLSMANSGKDTNGSQFFITLGECSELDGKHSVFGYLVGGMETLNRIELIRTNKDDFPLEKIQIKKITIFKNPFDEMEKKEIGEKNEHRSKDEKIKQKWFSGSKPQVSKVGKYINFG